MEAEDEEEKDEAWNAWAHALRTGESGGEVEKEQNRRLTPGTLGVWWLRVARGRGGREEE